LIIALLYELIKSWDASLQARVADNHNRSTSDRYDRDGERLILLTTY